MNETLTWFKFRRKWIRALKALSKAEMDRLLDAMDAYIGGEEPPEMEGADNIAWIFIESDLAEDRIAREKAADAHREAGARGGRPKTRGNAAESRMEPAEAGEEPAETKKDAAETKEIHLVSEEPEETKLPQSREIRGKRSEKRDKRSETGEREEKEREPEEPNGGERDTGASEKRERFSPPTPEEVRAYCHERGNNVDPQRWYDFYASKGWRIGANRMADWKAAVRRWEYPDDRPRMPAGEPLPAQRYEQRDYSGYSESLDEMVERLERETA